MRYLSTRGAAPRLDFRGVTLAGLASDGGLYLPERWPRLDGRLLESLAGASYCATAAAVIRPFVGDALDDAALDAVLEAAYGGFGHPAVAPLVQLDQRHWLLELFHGPTLAFKDIAMRFLGALFARFLGPGERLTILGATSGDTGSAALHALAGLGQVRVVMLHPAGRVSEVQRRQMTTVHAPNVLNIAVKGSFDDCQRLVKTLLGDRELRASQRLSAVNSINWARLLAQIVYYVHAAVRLGAPHRAVAFSVPTGNFGDVFAGHCARLMGLPVQRLVVATNVNDILVRALNEGDYSVGKVQPTQTPSMDIQVSSNFERLLFGLKGGDAAALAAAMRAFEANGRLSLDEQERAEAARGFLAERVDAAGMQGAMAWAHAACGQLIDPHTAVGLAAARARANALEGQIVTLATAHPAKFPEAVEAATGVRPALPARLRHLFEREERHETLAADAAALRARIEAWA